ncbi:protein strawberry notch homolog 1 [Aplysia californica]|uniref:Protein strawberry notch homolog 1 n=1 Tax=Aplysia californica TaxID=6500 RepID=A0ABM1A4S4_APLCA|nr:protein strawberry notch homolog 1 [Aplysia californica]
METENSAGEGFPDLISAALHGAGISGEDLAFDFSDFDDGSSDTAKKADDVPEESPAYISQPASQVLSQIPQQPTVHNTSSSANVMRKLANQAQQQQQLLLTQTVPAASQKMTIINPPHLRAQPGGLINATVVSSGVRGPQPQTVRLHAVSSQSTSSPQGVQSFRIIRGPAPAVRTQSSVVVQPSSTQGQLRSQPIPRHLVQAVSQPGMPQVISTHALTSVPSTSSGQESRGVKNIIRIPASSLGNGLGQGQQVIIQQPGDNGQVVRVTSRSGKPVTTEDITKIVSSLPKLKSGAKIIVNSGPNFAGDSKQQTIQLITKPPPPTVAPVSVQLADPSPVMAVPGSQPKAMTSLIMPRPIVNSRVTAPSPRSVLPSSPLTVSKPTAANPKISRLTYAPGAGLPHKLGQMGALSGLGLPSSVGGLSNIPDVPHLGHVKMSMSSKDLTKAWKDHNALRRVHSAQNLQRGLNRIPPEEEEIEEEVEELGHAETYAEYKPSKLNFGKKHPDPVVETSSLSSVEPPDVKYQLRILDECVDEGGKLSALQLESITYACQRHSTVLPNGERAGYLIGDGAGVGKGRTIAGVIFENYLHRRKRALWLSVSNDLRVDAERDLRDIGAGHIDVYPLNKFKYYAKISSKENNSCKKGVIFATYSSLIGESQAEGKYNTRLKQLLKWLGHDFEGLIVFDECHKAKNLCPTGSSKPTKTGQTVLELQNRLPKARVVYASATGASEPRNMAYMTRLGLWGQGTPFKEFTDFIQAVERRGVGAMELVAMDAKLRGMYIARQLSFHGVSFKIDEIPLEKDFIKVYNLAVEMWVEAREMFQQAAELIQAEHRMKKSMWGQFWSAHQRFFKYLCISSKVNHCVDLAREAVKFGKCVVIGLQSTGEARTMEQVEEAGGDLTDFVSTAKGVFQSLVERHFPASTRGRALDIIKQVSNSHINRDSPDPWKRKRDSDDLAPSKRQKMDNDSSDPESNDSDSSDLDGIDFMSSSNSSDSDGEEHNPFANGWNSDEDDPWCQKKKKKKEVPKKKKKVKKKEKESKNKESDNEDDEFDRALAKAGLLNKPSTTNGLDGHAGNWEKASAMKSELLSRIEFLGEKLPPNTLDQLIDELGGPENVAEMTGRKSRVVSTHDGVQFESRSESDVPLEILNLTEKQRFMDGEKCVAIISEAASSGISLQADRRAQNQKRRVHITLELPWSADRAIQQFGGTHRSNQVSAPEYTFLISELAGERRFAATVAKRLESLGALTHGDRRATETRDLSRFNIDNKYGRVALETVMKSVLDIQMDVPTVQPPKNYQGDFFKDVKDGLVGVGMINIDPRTGHASLEKDFNNISKFLNRILGMKVAVQNALFKYFTDTLTSIILDAKRNGRWDMGILDLGSGEEKVRKIETKIFVGNTATNTAKTELTKFAVERGMPWHSAIELWRRCGSLEEGFYCTLQDRIFKKTVVLAVVQGKNKKRELMYNLYRPNTGLQGRCETLEEIKKKYKKCLPDVAEPLWEDQYTSSETHCSHKYLRGNCRKAATGQQCEFGLRTRFYHVLSGSVLSVWSKVESVLVGLNAASRMQIIRLRTEENQRIVGSLIPPAGVYPLERVLSQDSAKTYTEKHDNPFEFLNQQQHQQQQQQQQPQPSYIPRNNFSSSSSFPNSLLSSSSGRSNSINSTHNFNNSSGGSMYVRNDSALSDAGGPVESPVAVEEVEEKPELLSMPTLVW